MRCALERLRVGVYTDDGVLAPSHGRGARGRSARPTRCARAGAPSSRSSRPDVREILSAYLGALSADGGAAIVAALAGGEVDPVARAAPAHGRGAGARAAPRRAGCARVRAAERRAHARRDGRQVGAPRCGRSPIACARTARRSSTRWSARASTCFSALRTRRPRLPHGASKNFTLASSYSILFNATQLPAGVVPVTRVRVEEARRDAGQRLAREAGREDRRGERGTARRRAGRRARLARPRGARGDGRHRERGERDEEYPRTPVDPESRFASACRFSSRMWPRARGYRPWSFVRRRTADPHRPPCGRSHRPRASSRPSPGTPSCTRPAAPLAPATPLTARRAAPRASGLPIRSRRSHPVEAPPAGRPGPPGHARAAPEPPRSSPARAPPGLSARAGRGPAAQPPMAAPSPRDTTQATAHRPLAIGRAYRSALPRGVANGVGFFPLAPLVRLDLKSGPAQIPPVVRGIAFACLACSCLAFAVAGAACSEHFPEPAQSTPRPTRDRATTRARSSRRPRRPSPRASASTRRPRPSSSTRCAAACGPRTATSGPSATSTPTRGRSCRRSPSAQDLHVDRAQPRRRLDRRRRSRRRDGHARRRDHARRRAARSPVGSHPRACVWDPANPRWLYVAVEDDANGGGRRPHPRRRSPRPSPSGACPPASPRRRRSRELYVTHRIDGDVTSSTRRRRAVRRGRPPRRRAVTRPSTVPNGKPFGFESLALLPDGRRAWIPHELLAPTHPIVFNETLFPAISVVDLPTRPRSRPTRTRRTSTGARTSSTPSTSSGPTGSRRSSRSSARSAIHPNGFIALGARVRAARTCSSSTSTQGIAIDVAARPAGRPSRRPRRSTTPGSASSSSPISRTRSRRSTPTAATSSATRAPTATRSRSSRATPSTPSCAPGLTLFFRANPTKGRSRRPRTTGCRAAAATSTASARPTCASSSRCQPHDPATDAQIGHVGLTDLFSTTTAPAAPTFNPHDVLVARARTRAASSPAGGDARRRGRRRPERAHAGRDARWPSSSRPSSRATCPRSPRGRRRSAARPNTRVGHRVLRRAATRPSTRHGRRASTPTPARTR